MNKYVVLFLLLSFAIGSACGQEEKSRKEKRLERRQNEFLETKELIESKVYTFAAHKANPSGGRQIDLATHIAELTIRKDSVESYLPFFGRAYMASYISTESGVKFNTELLAYKAEMNEKKRSFIISFSAKSKTDTYNCILLVSGSGSATLSVNSIKRAIISYNGQITPIKKEKSE